MSALPNKNRTWSPLQARQFEGFGFAYGCGCGAGAGGGVFGASAGAGAPWIGGIGVATRGAGASGFFLSLSRVLSLLVADFFFFLLAVSPARPRGPAWV